MEDFLHWLHNIPPSLSHRNFSHNQSRNPKPRNFRTSEGLQICVYMADIRKLSVDCIVNAANGQLMHGGGIAAVIADAAGPTFNKECSDYVKSYGEIKTGECCVTHAGRLPYKRVIHGVGPQWSKRNANGQHLLSLLRSLLHASIVHWQH
jgi:O-acetyl-ADP-ribose deacetylase (regulator of RNase III)